jgi:hypothetical protein
VWHAGKSRAFCRPPSRALTLTPRKGPQAALRHMEQKKTRRERGKSHRGVRANTGEVVRSSVKPARKFSSASRRRSEAKAVPRAFIQLNQIVNGRQSRPQSDANCQLWTARRAASVSAARRERTPATVPGARRRSRGRAIRRQRRLAADRCGLCRCPPTQHMKSVLAADRQSGRRAHATAHSLCPPR